MFVRTRGTQGGGMHTDDQSLVRSESSEKQNVKFESVKTFLIKMSFLQCWFGLSR